MIIRSKPGKHASFFAKVAYRLSRLRLAFAIWRA